MLFVSYSKKMDRDVLSSPASLNYRTRCIVNVVGSERNRLPKSRGGYDIFAQNHCTAKGWMENEDVTLSFIKYHWPR